MNFLVHKVTIADLASCSEPKFSDYNAIGFDAVNADNTITENENNASVDDDKIIIEFQVNRIDDPNNYQSGVYWDADWSN